MGKEIGSKWTSDLIAPSRLIRVVYAFGKITKILHPEMFLPFILHYNL